MCQAPLFPESLDHLGFALGHGLYLSGKCHSFINLYVIIPNQSAVGCTLEWSLTAKGTSGTLASVPGRT